MRKILLLLSVFLTLPFAHAGAKSARKPAAEAEGVEYTRKDSSTNFGDSVTLTEFNFRGNVTYKTTDGSHNPLTCHATYHASKKATKWDAYNVTTENDDCGGTIYLTINKQDPPEVKLFSNVDTDGGTPFTAIYGKGK